MLMDGHLFSNNTGGGILLDVNLRRLIFITLAILTAASPLARADSKDSKTFTSADGKYQLVLNKGWQTKDFHLDAVQIGALNKHLGEYVEVIAEDLQNYTDSLFQYAEAKRDTMAMSLDNPKMTAAQQVDVNGLAGLRYEIHGQLPNTETSVAFILTVTKTKTHYIQVVVWTKESHFKDDRADMENLANGFSEVKDKSDSGDQQK
jgi:hypothetical protein